MSILIFSCLTFRRSSISFIYFRSWKYQYGLWFSKFTAISVWTKKNKIRLPVCNVITVLITLKKNANQILCKFVLESKGGVSLKIFCRDWTSKPSFLKRLEKLKIRTYKSWNVCQIVFWGWWRTWSHIKFYFSYYEIIFWYSNTWFHQPI